MNICSECGAKRQCHVITLENGEGAGMGIPDGTEFYYCKPCWGILKDKHTAAMLLQGQTADLLRSVGHPSPHRTAQKLYDFLIEKGKPVV